MNPAILDTAVQQFIRNAADQDITRILLGKSPFSLVTSRELAEQIESRKRCEKKLPRWFNTPGIIYPPKLSVEQASSELTAQYKSRLLKGNHIIDLTGGFGIDSLYFALSASQVTHCEINADLSAIAAHNAVVLGVNNIQTIVADGIAYLASSPATFDTLFVDPSRRTHAGKVFFLKDCEPDIVSNLDLLFSRAQRIVVKTAPLLDLQSGLKELKQVSEIHVVSVKNECKEVLWVMDRDFTGEPTVTCAALNGEKEKTFTFKLSEEKNLEPVNGTQPRVYLYEPDAALLKAGAFKLIAKKFGIQKLHQHTHLYTSETLQKDFTGRTFVIHDVWGYKDFSKKNQVKKANVSARNFPLTVDQLRKKHKLEDGGTVYLFFTTVYPNLLTVIETTALPKTA